MHKIGHTGPYGDFFELTGGISEVDTVNPSAQDIARIQQDPDLQSEYLMHMLESGGVLGDDPLERFKTGMPDVDLKYASEDNTMYDWIAEKVGKYTSGELAPQMDPETYSWGTGQSWEDFLNLSEAELKEFFGYELTKGGWKHHEGREDILGAITNLQQGLKRLQGGDSGIDALTRELRLLETDVTGPGGLTQKKGSLADLLTETVAGKRAAYIPKEKVSRYGRIAGKGGYDPSEDYRADIGSDISSYGENITGLDKSISDILYGTDEGSIHDVYGTYGDLVKESLLDTGGDLWFS